ncbi:ABC-2 family transporter protein [Paenibacillus sp. NPDC093718]|uniref:ABC-2 family transporter protein n=1 Tax=Paenibacillus sp. NPDC093718 TaxID=3390601 RepID=UPI003D06137E
MITSVPEFWLVENKAIKNILFFQLKGFIRYPITIYNKVIQILLIYILPYAFINYFPA